MTISEKLESIKASKEAIKQAIEAKGVVCGDVLSEYPEKIASIQTGGDGIDMSKGVKFSYSSFTVEQFESLNTYNWDKVTNTDHMFYDCTKLTTIPKIIDISKATFTKNMFSYCTSLQTITLLDMSSVINATSMFSECWKLTTVPPLDMPKVQDATSMFYNSGIKSVSQLNMPVCINWTSMFGGCGVLTDVALLDVSALTSCSYMFKDCSKLTNLGGFRNLAVRLDLHYSTLLTVESLMNVINNLKDLTGGTAQTLILGATNLAKLTDEQKTVATNKNWVLA